MSYVERVIEQVKAKNAEQPEFIQAVTEVLTSLEPVIEAHPEYEAAGLLERIVEPERVIMFRVPWVDDEGKVQVNRGFRVQFNSCHGALQGRPAPASVREPGHHQVPRLRADLQEQPDHACPWAAARAAATSTRRASRTREVMRFCQSFMTELCRHIGADTDVPAGDIGTGAREIGYLFGQYKRITQRLGRRAHRQGPVLRRLAGPHAGDGLRPGLLRAGVC